MGAGERTASMTSEDIWPPRDRSVGVWLLVICVLVTAMILKNMNRKMKKKIICNGP
jgi:hypothetical protein